MSSSLRGKLALAGMFANGLRTVRRLAAETGADLVHAHWWVPGGIIAAANEGLGGPPFVITSHGTDIRTLERPAAARLYRWVAARAAGVTAVSSWLAQRGQDVSGRAVHVLPMPVDTGRFPAGPSERAVDLLFVGKLTAQKGLHHLLEALAIARTRPTLEVVGAGRVDDSALRDRARALGVDDRITWTPLLSQDELAARYRRASVLVIPAIDEGLGLTAVEAALSGAAVIAFASGGLTDLVRDGETGILLPPGDVHALAAAIDDLVSEPGRARAMGAAGRAFAVEWFSAEAVARSYAAVYRAALQGG